MNWILIAIAGYFLLAIEAVISKALLTGRIKSWQSYSAYVGLLSSVGFLVAVMGFFSEEWKLQWTTTGTFLIALISGFLFIIGLIFLYRALQFSSASRVYVLFGAVVTFFSYVLGVFLVNERHNLQNFIGIILLVMGGVMISYKFYKNKFFSTFKYVIIAGALVAFSLIFLKYVYDHQNFVSGYVYSRLGMFLSALAFLIIPFPGKQINFTKGKTKKARRKNGLDALAVLSAKTLAGIGAILTYYAISLGSVTVVNALVSVQYLFTVLLVVILGFFIKSLIENLTFKNIIFKSIGVLIVIFGVVLISIN
ncbi:MAG: EamA family transporter [Patescibacteria group bacterium]|jgi:drug/metabolite transporter (DMT)-like permease|nr:EamA family transporter [Patescibacteria group bacterium]